MLPIVLSTIMDESRAGSEASFVSLCVVSPVEGRCQISPTQTPERILHPRIRLTYAVYGRVTDGARTRNLL